MYHRPFMFKTSRKMGRCRVFGALRILSGQVAARPRQKLLRREWNMSDGTFMETRDADEETSKW